MAKPETAARVKVGDGFRLRQLLMGQPLWKAGGGTARAKRQGSNNDLLCCAESRSVASAVGFTVGSW